MADHVHTDACYDHLEHTHADHADHCDTPETATPTTPITAISQYTSTQMSAVTRPSGQT